MRWGDDRARVCIRACARASVRVCICARVLGTPRVAVCGVRDARARSGPEISYFRALLTSARNAAAQLRGPGVGVGARERVGHAVGAGGSSAGFVPSVALTLPAARNGASPAEGGMPRMHTTAYCGCGKCCGWEYGAALPLVPLYVPLTRGARRASGTRTWPLVPRARRRGLDGRHSQHGRWVADCMAVYVLETRRHAPPRNAPPMCSDGGGVVLLSRSRQNNTIRDERTRAPPFVVRNKMPARSGHSLYRRAVEHGTSAAIGAAIGAAVTVAVLARSRPLAPTGHGRRGGHGRVWRTGGSASEGKAAAG